MRWFIFAAFVIAVAVAVDIYMPFTRFPAGQYYEFNGRLECANSEPIGSDCVVHLMEDDDVSFNDVIDETKIGDGFFTVRSGTGVTDPPTSDLELFLQFSWCCGYSYFGDKLSGYLKNATNGWRVTYTLVDDDFVARIYGRKFNPKNFI